MDVPRSLKHLIQKVMRAFYSIESVIIIDILIRKHTMKEDDLLELLKFERKQMRSLLAMLRNDKLIKCKLRIETAADGKSSKHNYYYINYGAFINVVKYKLDHMRKRIEMEERDMTSRSAFICQGCNKSFTDLEVGELVDHGTGELRCSFCGNTVNEDPNHLPKSDSRLVLAKFNNSMEPLYILLKDIEDIRIPSDLLEPEINIKPEPLESSVTTDGGNGTKQWRDSDRNRAINSEYENMVFNEQHNLTVKIEDFTNNTDGIVKSETIVKKEQPAWMMESTVTTTNGISNNNSINEYASTSKSSKPLKVPSSVSSSSHEPIFNDHEQQSKEILETLLMHEKQHEHSNAALLFGSDNGFCVDVNGDHNDDEIMSEYEDDDDIETNTPKVKIKGVEIPLNEIDDEIIAQMNDEERECYIQVTQQVYAHMYD